MISTEEIQLKLQPSKAHRDLIIENSLSKIMSITFRVNFTSYHEISSFHNLTKEKGRVVLF